MSAGPIRPPVVTDPDAQAHRSLRWSQAGVFYPAAGWASGPAALKSMMNGNDIERLFQAIAAVRQSQQFWWALNRSDCDEQVEAFRNGSRTQQLALIMRRHAHIAVIVPLHAVLDDRRKLSFARLKEVLGPRQVTRLGMILEKHDRTIKGVRRIRHNQLAHLAPNEDPTATYSSAKVTPEGLEDLIKDLYVFMRDLDPGPRFVLSDGGRTLVEGLKANADSTAKTAP